MPTIEQYRTPVRPSGGLAYHYSWVKRKDDGSIETRFDGWPTLPNGDPDTYSTGFGRPLRVHPNRPMAGLQELMGTYTGSQDEINRRWAAGQAAADAINANPPRYRATDDVDLDTHEPVRATNSNSVHSTIGNAMGFDTSDQVGGSAPGLGRQLLPEDFTPPGETLPPATLTLPDGQSSLDLPSTEGLADMTDTEVDAESDDFASRYAATMEDEGWGAS